MNKSPDAFRTISEVAEWLGVQAHVLRFWESKFNQVKPVKRAGGRRYYRPDDMQLLGGIKQLLHDDGMTIKGVQKLLREQGVPHVAAMSPPLDGIEDDIAADPVLQFRNRPEAESESAPVEQPPAPEPPVVEEVAAPELDLEPEPEAQPEPEPEPEPVEAMAEVEAEAPPPKTSSAPNLPSFMSRAADPADEPEARKVPIVDAPDPPSETEIAISPGPLSRLSRVHALTPDQAAQIAPLVAELRGYLGQASGQRA